MKICPNCSASNEENATFCENCGTPLEQPQAPLFEQEPSAAEAFDLEQPTAPKKKKTGLIVGICAAAVSLVAAGAVAAVMLLGGSPMKKLEKAIDKTFAALPASSAETPNLEKAMENMNAREEDGKLGAKLDVKAKITQDYEDMEPYSFDIGLSAAINHDTVNKIGSASVGINLYDEKVEAKLSYDHEKFMLSIPAYLDTAVSFRTKEFGQDLKHLGDIGLIECDETMEALSLDLFPDKSESNSLDFAELVARIKTECAEEARTFEESIVVGKSAAATVSYQDKNVACTAYPVEVDLDATVALYEKCLQIYLDEYTKYMKNMFWLAQSTTDMDQAELEESFRNELQDGFDVFLDAIRQLKEQNFQMTFYVKDGYFIGFKGFTDTVDATFLLLGEENPWSDFVLKGAYNAEAVFELRGGLTSDNGTNKFALDITDAGKLELTYTDSTGNFSFGIFEGAEEIFLLTGSVKPTETGMAVTAAFIVEEDVGHGSYAYTQSTDITVSLTMDQLTETPTHIADNALALGEATEEELFALMMQLMY